MFKFYIWELEKPISNVKLVILLIRYFLVVFFVLSFILIYSTFKIKLVITNDNYNAPPLNPFIANFQ